MLFHSSKVQKPKLKQKEGIMRLMDLINVGFIILLVAVVGIVVYKIHKSVQEEKKNQVLIQRKINYKKQMVKL
ncbi:MAG TPA: hypothetical protein DDX39_01935 [Bacteroidales bacterium]|nr:MAG: hypothetical protein A2W98_08150 [Bacteroidetes bacterium GWF2_33_38]OFY71459.1 MAG: hypothetical protein A2265_00990 [Bacteroidetes bacterium RIFOXYA12_FULL_33_9]HBF87373.1 hypothetical protein [Bacteroidales bacterium]